MKKNRNTIRYSIIRPITKAVIYFLFRPNVIGLENVPRDEAFVLAGNHTKWIDPVMLVGVAGRKQLHFLAKEEMWHSPIGWLTVKAMSAIPVNRKIHDKDALENAYNHLRSGKSIGIFPEGTINRTDDIAMPFKIGAVKMCKETGVKLVPFVITGKYKIFKKSLTVQFLKPREITKELDLENEKFRDEVVSKLEDYFLETGEKKVKRRGKKNGKR